MELHDVVNGWARVPSGTPITKKSPRQELYIYTGCGKKTSPIWRGRCVSCGGDTAAEGVSIDSG
jgi:hypothetical protein